MSELAPRNRPAGGVTSIDAARDRRPAFSAGHVPIEQILLGHSPAIQRVRWLIEKLARASVPVLVHGPTGVGKELVARALHVASGRRGPLVACNVCAIADGLFESTMFGHVRGAFTGAVADSSGILSEADGGTAFLDEIGGLGLPAQAKLLRALESHEFRPVGAGKDRRSDFRVVAATNDDLAALAVAGRFRSDLLYRLNGAVIEVPSLSARPDDIPLLARSFAGGVSIEGPALRLLLEQSWPGNVRELRTVVECAVAFTDQAEITMLAVREALDLRGTAVTSATTGQASREESHGTLLGILRACEGDIDAVAAILGVHRATVYRRLRRQQQTGRFTRSGSEKLDESSGSRRG